MPTSRRKTTRKTDNEVVTNSESPDTAPQDTAGTVSPESPDTAPQDTAGTVSPESPDTIFGAYTDATDESPQDRERTNVEVYQVVSGSGEYIFAPKKSSGELGLQMLSGGSNLINQLKTYN